MTRRLLQAAVCVVALFLAGEAAAQTATVTATPSPTQTATPTLTPTPTQTPTPTATVTPVPNQNLGCRTGAGPAGSCGGLCAEGYQCVYVPENADCSCQVDAKVCRTGVVGANGYCAMKPSEVGGNCTQRGRIYRCE